MNHFVKIYGSIIRSTVWAGQPAHTKLVWVTLLILADSDGRVEGSVPGLASTAGVSIEECEEALATFMAPDKYSRTKEHEGRRLTEIPGGWFVLNHSKYRDMRTPAAQKQAERQKRYRDKQKRGDVASVAPRDDEHNDRHPLRDDDGKRHPLRMSRADLDLDLDLNAPPTSGGRSKTPARERDSEVVVTRPPGARTHFAPEDFTPNETHRARALELGLDVEAEAERFRLHEFERPYSDWPKRFSAWLIKARTMAQTEAFKGSRRAGPGPRGATKLQPDAGRTGWESLGEDDDEDDDEAANG